MRQYSDYQKELNRIAVLDVIEETALLAALFVIVLMIIN